MIRRVFFTVVMVFASSGLAQADFPTGEAAYKAGNFGDAYLELLGPAHAGDARAQFLLGQMSDSGYGPVALDPREAARWYKLAAAKDHAEAQYSLAQAYALGRGVKQDKDLALLWLTKAADQNLKAALVDLAQIYDDGRGVQKDQVKATALMERAAALGDPDAQYFYAERLMTGIGTLPDQKRAWELFRRAADSGQPAALYRIGKSLFIANRTIEDNIQAYVLLVLAERRGTEEVKRSAAQDRATLAKDMTPDDIAAAMQRVRGWKPVGSSGTTQGR